MAVALALGLALLYPRQEAAGQLYVDLLLDEHAHPVMYVSADRERKVLTVKDLAPIPIGADRSLELWALPPGANPRPLGLIAASGVTRISLAGAADAVLNVPALAVSIEPAGGSPTGLPTGPVVYTGPLAKL